MKCRAVSRIYRNQPNANQKKVLNQECERVFHKYLEQYNKMVILQIMHILHFDFGFGKKRLKRFFSKLKEMQNRHIERYEVKDDDVPDICEIQLRDVGIRLEDFFETE